MYVFITNIYVLVINQIHKKTEYLPWGARCHSSF